MLHQTQHGRAVFNSLARPRWGREICVTLPWVAPTAIQVAVLRTTEKEAPPQIYSALNRRMKSCLLTRRVKMWIAARGTCGVQKTGHNPGGVTPILRTGRRLNIAGRWLAIPAAVGFRGVRPRPRKKFSRLRAACPSARIGQNSGNSSP